MTEEELIEYIFILESEVDFLREELRKEKKKTSDKINKDYEDNRNMIANIFKEVVKNDTKRKTTMEEDLNRVWDICNWYLDYTQNNKITEKDLLELIENYEEE